MPSVVVRDAVPEDGRAIARVRTRTWQAAYAHVFTPEQLASISEEDGARRWSEAIERRQPRVHILVAEEDHGVVGFASMGPERDPADRELGELYTIYVLPELNGFGIGRALMSEVHSRFRAEGFAEAILWVIDDNPRARRFYEHAGWHTDGAVKEEHWLGTSVREIRYRISFEPTP